jgi:hypothetical protein
VRTNKLRIIQLLEADLNQLLRIAFARNITKLSRYNEVGDHQPPIWSVTQDMHVTYTQQTVENPTPDPEES